MKKKRKYKGGAGKMVTLTIKNQEHLIDSAKTKTKKLKTDWEELADECSAIAKEAGITPKRSQELLALARKILNGNNR